MKLKWICLIVAGCMLLTGCASAPAPVAFDTLWVAPNPVPTGNRVFIRVTLIDPGHAVQSIRAYLLPERSFSVLLNDMGQLGDRLAGDGEWGVYVDVAGAAPTGIYPWEIELLDKSGAVLMRDNLPLRLKTVIEILPST